MLHLGRLGGQWAEDGLATFFGDTEAESDGLRLQNVTRDFNSPVVGCPRFWTDPDSLPLAGADTGCAAAPGGSG